MGGESFYSMCDDRMHARLRRQAFRGVAQLQKAAEIILAVLARREFSCGNDNE